MFSKYSVIYWKKKKVKKESVMNDKLFWYNIGSLIYSLEGEHTPGIISGAHEGGGEIEFGF